MGDPSCFASARPSTVAPKPSDSFEFQMFPCDRCGTALMLKCVPPWWAELKSAALRVLQRGYKRRKNAFLHDDHWTNTEDDVGPADPAGSMELDCVSTHLR